jgi:hypothetical protein
MPMNIVDEKFNEWTQGLDQVQARISVFRHIRDIPYAVVPSIMDYRGYRDILKIGLGSCSPKHFLLCEMFQRLGLPALYVVYPHRWEEIAKIMGEYSERLEQMALALPVSRHLACKVEIDDRLVLVDATIDLPLQKAGFTVNAGWDGKSDMLLPVTPIGAEDWYYHSEGRLMRTSVAPQFQAFYPELNRFLDQMRRLYNYLLVIDE